jgi:hypothetical protein
VSNTSLVSYYTGKETGTITRQWHKDGDAIPGATDGTYTPTEPGSYTITISIPGSASKTSAPVIITLEPIPAALAEKFWNDASRSWTVAVHGFALTDTAALTSTADGSASFLSTSAAFSGFTKLKSIHAPGLRSVGDYTFEGCTSLRSVDLPVATTFGSYTFLYCTSLAMIPLGATPPAMGSSTLFNTGTTALTIKVPRGSVSDYTTWKADNAAKLAIPTGKSVPIEAL